MTKKIYIALPYSFNPKLSELVATSYAADLISNRIGIPFSPVTHGHRLAKFMSEKDVNDSYLWHDLVLPYLRCCDEIHAIEFDQFTKQENEALRNKSTGFKLELYEAKQLGIPIEIVSVKTPSEYYKFTKLEDKISYYERLIDDVCEKIKSPSHPQGNIDDLMSDVGRWRTVLNELNWVKNNAI